MTHQHENRAIKLLANDSIGHKLTCHTTKADQRAVIALLKANKLHPVADHIRSFTVNEFTDWLTNVIHG